jgi:cytochrome c oxidase cbb3-type subunit 3/ubiquinol-cytochrome c reductase cytochrome c subunit
MMKRLQTGLSPGPSYSLFDGGLFTDGLQPVAGQPNEAHRWRAPAEITDFDQLFAQNCAGCHGKDGKLGAALSLNDPLYQSFVSDDVLGQVISKGRGISMPAFSQQSGGPLTDQQITLLTSGMRTRWSKPDDFKGVELPRYSINQTATSNDPQAAAVNGSPVNGAAPHDASRGAAA